MSDALDTARLGDAPALENLFRRLRERPALYSLWVEAAPRPPKESARDAVVALEKASRAGALSRLTGSITARLTGNAERAMTAEAASAEARLLALGRLCSAFSELDPASRAVLWLRDFEYRTAAGAAEVLVVSEHVLEQRLGRAREQLRGRLRILRRDGHG